MSSMKCVHHVRLPQRKQLRDNFVNSREQQMHSVFSREGEKCRRHTTQRFHRSHTTHQTTIAHLFCPEHQDHRLVSNHYFANRRLEVSAAQNKSPTPPVPRAIPAGANRNVSSVASDIDDWTLFSDDTNEPKTFASFTPARPFWKAGWVLQQFPGQV